MTIRNISSRDFSLTATLQLSLEGWRRNQSREVLGENLTDPEQDMQMSWGRKEATFGGNVHIGSGVRRGQTLPTHICGGHKIGILLNINYY